jgi:hypothetical protein
VVGWAWAQSTGAGASSGVWVRLQVGRVGVRVCARGRADGVAWVRAVPRCDTRLCDRCRAADGVGLRAADMKGQACGCEPGYVALRLRVRLMVDWQSRQCWYRDTWICHIH